jgi:LmbE family N-acetylglucosaminyl deacetylase
MITGKKTLVVAPHPDDEVLGCGGFIKKMSSQGEDVWILIMSRGKKGLYSEERIVNVRNEALMAHKVLGVAGTRFLDFPAPELDTISVSELSSAISGIIEEIKPDTLLLPHRGDIHHDHRAVFNASIVAGRPLKGISIKRILSYETLSETEWAAPFADDLFFPDYFVNISDFFSAKLEAFGCYKSQLKEFPATRSLKTIEALANLRGSTVGFSHAEAFMTVRIVED